MESSNGHRGHSAQHQWTGNTPGRPLRIAMIMPPWYEVPPAGYGGLERVCASLIDGLIARGHDVTLFGTGTGTGTGARFVSTNPELQFPRLLESMPELVHVTQVNDLLEQDHFDIVHDHTTVGPVTAGRRRAPSVVTVHGCPVGDLNDVHVASGQIGGPGRDLPLAAPDGRRPALDRDRPSWNRGRRTGEDGAVGRAGAVAGSVRPGEGAGPGHRGLPQGGPAAGAGRQGEPAERVALPGRGHPADAGLRCGACAQRRPGPDRRPAGRRRARCSCRSGGKSRSAW